MFKREMKVSEFFDEWLEILVKGNVRYNTYVAYKGYVDNHIKRFMADKIICELKPSGIQEIVVDMIKEGRLCSRTIGSLVRMMKSAFSYAVDYEIILSNPVRRIKLPKIDDAEVEIFSNYEQTKIERAVLKSNDNRHYGILLSLYTGLRIGELCALRWKNIDFSNRCLYIKKSVSRTEVIIDSNKKIRYCESDPKTKKSKRTIHLPEFFVLILKRLKFESVSEYVFSMKNGKLIQPRTMQYIYKRLLIQAGVKYNNFHVLRHTFATRVAELNADPKTVSETLGHSNTMITLNRYTHSLTQQKQKMMSNLNNYFKSKTLIF